MNNKEENLNNPFAKAFMAGLFTGLIATVASLVYNLFYRGVTHFDLSAIINVSTIIFVLPFILMLAGLIYYPLSKYKAGAVIYSIVLTLLIIVAVLLDFNFQRSADPVLTGQFRQLLLGIIAICGLSSFFIPYMATHETNII